MTDLLNELAAKRDTIARLQAELKADALAAVVVAEIPKLQVAAAAGISRPTLDAWLKG